MRRAIASAVLCVVDFKPARITFEQGEALRRLGRQVVTLLELRRSLLQLQQAKHELQDQREKSERLLGEDISRFGRPRLEGGSARIGALL